ncbi:MAG: acyl-CoA dehydrogenase, partial [Actinomycetes bacterium]
MDFALSPRAADLQGRLLAFMDECVYPAEPVYEEQMAALGDPHGHPQIVEDLKAEARSRGLWNLFMPHQTEWTPDPVNNLDYAHLAEVSGRAIHLAPEAMNCSAPDTGNMEVLALFGTPEQQDTWLQ